MEWRRRWEIRFTWRPGLRSRVLVRRVDTTTQLRAVLTWARAHPDITAVRYEPVRELVGDTPSSCRRGHPHEGGSATAVRTTWLQCRCGGHLVLHCRWPGCSDILVDPPAGPDCTAHPPG